MAPWIKAKNGNVFEIDDEDLAAKHARRPGARAFETDPRDGDAAVWTPDGDEVAPVPDSTPNEAGPGPAPLTARSTKAEWLAKAKTLGIEVPSGASKQQVVALVEEHEAAAESQPTGDNSESSDPDVDGSTDGSDDDEATAPPAEQQSSTSW